MYSLYIYMTQLFDTGVLKAFLEGKGDDKGDNGPGYAAQIEASVTYNDI